MQPVLVKQSGLTLIEVLLALLLLSMGAFSMLLAGNQSLRLARNVETSLVEASMVEDIRSLRRAYARAHPDVTVDTGLVEAVDCLSSACTIDELRRAIEGPVR